MHIINLVADPEKTRKGRVLQTLLEKLEKIRKELGKDKVFDVIGHLFEGKTLAGYMEDITQRKTSDAAKDIDTRVVTKQRVEEIQRADRERYGDGGEVERELPKLQAQRTQEERRRIMPGFIRRFAEKAAPLADIRLEGDLHGIFSLRAHRPFALDRFLPLMDAYPPEKRNRFSVIKPDEDAHAVFFHPGEPVFDRLRAWIISRFGRDALRGGVFVHAEAREPYAFHLALVTIIRRADPQLPALKRPEIIESRLLGIRQNSHSETCPVEYLLLLRGAQNVPDDERPAATQLAAKIGHVEAFACDIGQEMVQAHRKRIGATIDEREAYLRMGFDYQEAELSESRTRLKTKAIAGDAQAERELMRIKQRQMIFYTRRDEALSVRN